MDAVFCGTYRTCSIDGSRIECSFDFTVFTKDPLLLARDKGSADNSYERTSLRSTCRCCCIAMSRANVCRSALSATEKFLVDTFLILAPNVEWCPYVRE